MREGKYDPFGMVKLVQNIAVKRVAAAIHMESEVPIWDYVVHWMGL